MLLNNAPPDNRLAICHTGRGPNRNTHARTAGAIASSTSPNTLPAGSTAPNSASSTTAQRVKCARIASPRNANRRSQPRTVSAATPSRAAIRRCPSP